MHKMYSSYTQIMATFQTFCLILFLVQVNVTTAQTENHFATKVTEINHYMDTSDSFLSAFAYRGVTQCLSSCKGIPPCRSFFFHKENKVCHLHSELFEDIASLTNIYGTMYFKMVTVQSNFTCPPAPPPTLYTPVLLSDNTVFSYRLVWDNKRRTDAVDICLQEGGALLRIFTLAKMMTLITLLNTCAGYTGTSDYWIDGSNLVAVDFFNITQWTTSLYEPLPTSTQFWATTQLTSPDKDHCIVLSSNHGYKWINTKCDYPEKHYFICEK